MIERHPINSNLTPRKPSPFTTVQLVGGPNDGTWLSPDKQADYRFYNPNGSPFIALPVGDGYATYCYSTGGRAVFVEVLL